MALALGERVGCILLAAGAAMRFGGDKLLALLGDKPLLQHAIDAACAAGVTHCTLVLGAGCERILASVDTRRCAMVLNQHWRRGIASSIRCGLRMHNGDDACILLVADQPYVTTADLNRLIEMWRAAPAQTIVALRAGTVWGSPVLFPRGDFSRLMRLSGDAGAKRLAAQRKDRLTFVEASDARAFVDVDTRADLSRLNAPGSA